MLTPRSLKAMLVLHQCSEDWSFISCLQVLPHYSSLTVSVICPGVRPRGPAGRFLSHLSSPWRFENSHMYNWIVQRRVTSACTTSIVPALLTEVMGVMWGVRQRYQKLPQRTTHEEYRTNVAYQRCWGCGCWVWRGLVSIRWIHCHITGSVAMIIGVKDKVISLIVSTQVSSHSRYPALV